METKRDWGVNSSSRVCTDLQPLVRNPQIEKALKIERFPLTYWSTDSTWTHLAAKPNLDRHKIFHDYLTSRWIFIHLIAEILMFDCRVLPGPYWDIRHCNAGDTELSSWNTKNLEFWKTSGPKNLDKALGTYRRRGQENYIPDPMRTINTEQIQRPQPGQDIHLQGGRYEACSLSQGLWIRT